MSARDYWSAWSYLMEARHLIDHMVRVESEAMDKSQNLDDAIRFNNMLNEVIGYCQRSRMHMNSAGGNY